MDSIAIINATEIYGKEDKTIELNRFFLFICFYFVVSIRAKPKTGGSPLLYVVCIICINGTCLFIFVVNFSKYWKQKKLKELIVEVKTSIQDRCHAKQPPRIDLNEVD